MNKILTIFCLLLFAVASASAAEKMYKWTDEAGTVHFSAIPPEGTETQELKLQPGPKPAAPTAEADADTTRDAQRAANCELAQKNFDTLTNNSIVEVEAPDGSRRTLSLEEREAQLAAEQKRVELFCTEEAEAP